MKKHLIAAAVAAAVAVPAMAQVTVYGRFDQSYNSVDTKTATTSKSVSSGFDGGIGGSRLGFRAAEDLGGGLKAAVVYEFGVDAGENSGVGSTRLGFAEVSGGFGTFRMGRQVSPAKVVADTYNALGNNTNFTPGDVNGSITGIDQRVSNAVTYLTPTVAGFSAQIQHSDSNTKTTTETSTILVNGATGADGATTGPFRITQQGKIEGVGLFYAVGPLAIGAATHNQTVAIAGAVTKDDRVAVAATYLLGSTRIHVENSTRKSQLATGATDIDRDVTTIGITQPFGATTITAQLFDGDRKLGTTDTTAADFDGFKVRATYALSKRTGVYANLGETNTKPTNGTQRTSVEGYGIGLFHTF